MIANLLKQQIKRVVADFVRDWDRFWFSARDSHHLCVMRLLAGWMLFYSHLVWGLDFDAFFGDAGFNNAELVKSLQADGYAGSFWWYVPDDWKYPVHIACCAVIFLFFVGAFTRVTSVLSWVIAVSYVHRAMLANFGLDQVLCMLTFYLMFTPCGDFLSVDSWIRRWRSRPEPFPSVMTNLASRLIQCHLCVIYFFAGLSKLQGESWWRGDAVWNALANYEYQSTDMTFLAHWPIVSHLLSLGTVLWEVSFCMLVWNKRIRPFVLCVGLSMHLGIGAFMGMWTFGLAMTFSYLSFVPGESIKRALKCVRERSFRDLVSLRSEDRFREHALVLVCKSIRVRDSIMGYLERKGHRVYWVDDMEKAFGLCHRLRSVVVCINASAETVDWVDRIRDANPEVKFVIYGTELPHGDRRGCVSLEAGSTHRKLRNVCEDLMGRPIRGTSGVFPNDVSGNIANERPRRIVASGSGEEMATGDMPPAPSVTIGAGSKVTCLLLLGVSILMGGCGRDYIDLDSELNRAASLNDLKRFDEALAVLAKDEIARSEHPRLHYLRGVAFEQLLQFEAAARAYTDCLRVDPTYTDALNNRAVVYGKLDQIDAAIEDLSRAVTINPEDSLAWANLGLAYHEQGQYQLAIAQYDEADKNGDSPQIPFQRGNAYLAMGLNKEALDEFTRAVARDTQYAEAFLNLAIALYRLDRPDEATSMLAKAEQVDASMSVTALAQNLRDVLNHSHKHDWAFRQIQAWLNASGWEISDVKESSYCFQAQRIPVAGERPPSEQGAIPLPPDDFFGIVLLKSADQAVRCPYGVIEWTRKWPDRTYCWFVLDEELLQFDQSADGEIPKALVSANYDWTPTADQVTLSEVILKLPGEVR